MGFQKKESKVFSTTTTHLDHEKQADGVVAAQQVSLEVLQDHGKRAAEYSVVRVPGTCAEEIDDEQELASRCVREMLDYGAQDYFIRKLLVLRVGQVHQNGGGFDLLHDFVSVIECKGVVAL